MLWSEQFPERARGLGDFRGWGDAETLELPDQNLAHAWCHPRGWAPRLPIDLLAEVVSVGPWSRSNCGVRPGDLFEDSPNGEE